MSENTRKVFDYLKGIHGTKNVTSADVAEALGLEKRTVDGVFTGLQKKGLGARVEAEAMGEASISFLSITEDGKACDTAEMSETIKAILAYLADHEGDNVTLDDLADGVGVAKRSVNGSFNSLVKKGYCARTAAVVEAPVTVKLLVLTEEGANFDPTAVDAE
jgi:DNA-binding MarR family transcriptional regulator